MKRAKLLHNPNAGSGEHDDSQLIELLKSNGFECDYASVKEKDWEEIDPHTDFLVIGGGDGTVRKTVKQLLRRTLLDGVWPIGLLPLGTANNIASTLGLKDRKPEELVQSWHHNRRLKFDVGRLTGVDKTDFFIEGFGFGLFPYMVAQAEKKEPVEYETPEESMKAALEKFHEAVLSYEAKDGDIDIDGKKYSGKFLMAEVMNTRAIGPNIILSPNGHPGDGELDVVVVPEADREAFSSYITDKINGIERDYPFVSFKASRVKISWDGVHVHADDEMFKMKKGAEVTVEIKKGVLEFLVP